MATAFFKLRPVTIIEISLMVLFGACFVLTKTNVKDLASFAFFPGSLLAALYFPFGFYTLKSPDIVSPYPVAYGVLFSLSLISIMFSLIGVDLAEIFLMLFLVLFFMAVLLPVMANVLFEYQNAMIIMYYKGYTVRYLFLAILMVYALMTYKF